MMKRTEVYRAIDSEREYQDERWSKGSGYSTDKERLPSEWIVYIERHLALAKDEIYNYDNKGAMVELRKVAALCVAAAEANGMSLRTTKGMKQV